MAADIVRVGAAHHTASAMDLRDDVRAGLAKPPGQRTLPTMLLYDERGLRLYDDITTNAPEYYLFPAEEEILKAHAPEIADAMRGGAPPPPEEIVLELGAGALRKTKRILAALAADAQPDARAPPITYYALDLEERELARTLRQLAQSDAGPALKDRVAARGMLGTYDDGIHFVDAGGLRAGGPAAAADGGPARDRAFSDASEGPAPASDASDASSSGRDARSTPPSTPGLGHAPLRLLFLGSSLGNFDRAGAAPFLRALPLRAGAGDTLLLGLDHDNAPANIERAYNDAAGHTTAFIMNGLRAAGRALGDEALFSEEKWEYVNRYNVDERRHEAYYRVREPHTVTDPAGGATFAFARGEEVAVEQSHKFSERDAWALFADAQLRPIQRWTDVGGRYSLWLLERAPFAFPLLKTPGEKAGPWGLPTLAEWEDMWAVWNFVTLRMIPPELLFKKPIDLRHICLFYLGHIPTFTDIHLSRLLGEPHTEPESFKHIFERGIDPNVDDPTQCHSHSEVPENDEDWPTLEEILEFRDRVWERTRALYTDLASGRRELTRAVARVLFMVFEHQGYHTETLLFMLLQTAGTGPHGTLPPPDFIPPPWASLARTWDAAPTPASPTVTLGPATVTLGLDDIESEDEDADKRLAVDGHAFGWDNESPRREVEVGAFRIAWRPVTNGEFLEFWNGAGRERKVKFPKSWVEVDGEVRVRTLYGPVRMETARHWPVLTDADALSTYATVKGGRLPTEAELRLFLDRFDCGYEGGKNVGFRSWHPVPATTGGARDGARGHNGGVWEWTATVLDAHDGFVPSARYPGFSADFFDGVHNVVLGGSYGLIPRMAERPSLRNYFQRNYGYAWTAGRVAYDV